MGRLGGATERSRFLSSATPFLRSPEQRDEADAVFGRQPGDESGEGVGVGGVLVFSATWSATGGMA
jgi:hypothetical protein